MVTTRKKKLPADCMPNCATCAFASGDLNGDAECRRYPKVFVVTEEASGFMYPPVKPGQWCGEYVRRLND